jgi:membrane protease YdiL (CAAX protease family)
LRASVAAEVGPAERRQALVEALSASVAVTALVTLASRFVPQAHVASAVGAIFLGATWFLVFRKDDATVVRAGLALGGLVLPGRLDVGSLARQALVAVAIALAFAVVIFVPFFFGWVYVWRPPNGFHFAGTFGNLGSSLLGQLAIIALPEEAFYRGYLQTRLDDVFPPRRNVFGARIGVSLWITSAVFALGHLATVPDAARLAVFFPSLLFGWMRARTGGIGAAVVFHALCNVYSEALGRGFGVY